MATEVNEQVPKDSLLPCPWCGSDDIFVYAFNDGGTRVEYVQCRNCTSCGPDHKKGRHWNNMAALVGIRNIIDSVETRCLAADGPVINTRHEMTDDELRQIYVLAGGQIHG